jgi:aldose 1-epimerase
LHLLDGRIGPYRYRATLGYALDEGGLKCVLKMTNTGETMPFGGGFHPWFPRFSDTNVKFAASGVWLEDNSHLPIDHISLHERPEWNFDAGAGLPDDAINNAFSGWCGRARIVQPRLGIAVTLEAAAPLNTLLVYSPGADSPFFCLEPVSHPVDAHNMPEKPGLVVLETGATLALAMRLGWTPLEGA